MVWTLMLPCSLVVAREVPTSVHALPKVAASNYDRREYICSAEMLGGSMGNFTISRKWSAMALPFFASLTSEYIDMKLAAIVIDVDVKDLKVGVRLNYF